MKRASGTIGTKWFIAAIGNWTTKKIGIDVDKLAYQNDLYNKNNE